MEKLQDRRVGKEALEVRGVIGPAVKLDDMRIAVPGRDLHDAQTVAMGVKAHGLAVHGDQ
jgi:hypothetical protein